MREMSHNEVSEYLSQSWCAPGLKGQRYIILGNALGEASLLIVEQATAVPLKALCYHGWMALEILVENVDELAVKLQGSAFEILRPVADLDVSDKIRACQVLGPAGEVLYLTQIKGEVPPFELPRARCEVDRLFIPVMSTPNRDASLAFYEQFEGTQGLCFETKITVVNQAFGFDLDRRHAVATVQLKGESLIEIDEIVEAEKPSVDTQLLPAGIALVSFEVENIESLGIQWRTPPAALHDAPFSGRIVGLAQGAGGELVQLMGPEV